MNGNNEMKSLKGKEDRVLEKRKTLREWNKMKPMRESGRECNVKWRRIERN